MSCACPHLSLDISQQATGSQAEHLGTEPIVAQLLFDQREPHQGLLSRPDAPRWLKAHLREHTPRSEGSTLHLKA